MYFQASEYKGRNFLELNNNNNILIYLTYTKDRAWLKHFSSSNLLCVCIARLVTNHAPISEYRLEFFRKEPIAYPYSVKIVDGGLYFIFPFHFILFSSFLFVYFSIFRTAQVRGYQSRCHISHNLMA